MKICKTLAEAQNVPGVIRVHFNADGEPVAYVDGDELPAELIRRTDVTAEKIEALKAQITPYMVACAMAGDKVPLDGIMKQIDELKLKAWNQ